MKTCKPEGVEDWRSVQPAMPIQIRLTKSILAVSIAPMQTELQPAVNLP
ncbi:MAG: hypothetical protein R2706_15315 [Acidimicrobiales bacterium]